MLGGRCNSMRFLVMALCLVAFLAYIRRESKDDQTALVAGDDSRPRIGLGFTTSKRPETFKLTYLSFRARCLDCGLIDDWYAVDDGSSDEELADMAAIAPNVKWLDKPTNQSGHVGSVNTLLKVAAGYDYFVWLEDDWYFIKNEYLVSKAITILKNNLNVAQVLFNQDYRVTDHKDEAEILLGGDHRETSGVNYLLHKYCGPAGSTEHTQCSQSGKLSNYHWPYFSLNPGVWSMAQMSALGAIQAGQHFEYLHALKYAEQGLKTVFLPGVHAVHLGKANSLILSRPYIAAETYAKHGISLSYVGESAYDLTGSHA